MNKSKQMPYDNFSGTGVISAEITPAVEGAIVKTIEKLLANHSVEDLTDGNLISYSLMRYYHIAISVAAARDYYEKWVQDIRKKAGGDQ
jgi:hypothetical protein